MANIPPFWDVGVQLYKPAGLAFNLNQPPGKLFTSLYKLLSEHADKWICRVKKDAHDTRLNLRLPYSNLFDSIAPSQQEVAGCQLLNSVLQEDAEAGLGVLAAAVNQVRSKEVMPSCVW